MLYPVFYDTETTGLSPEGDRIIELAAYDPLHNKTFCEFINPGKPIPEEAQTIHHITDEMVKDAPFFEVVGKAFLEFCSNGSVLIAHNNDTFDRKFLEAEYGRVKIPFPAFFYIDTLKWARKYRPDLPRHTLQYLREVYSVPANTAHRALDDVFILHQVFCKMTDDLNLEDVLALLKTVKEEDSMPFGKYQGKPLREIPKDYVEWLAKKGFFQKPENQKLFEMFKKIGAVA